MSYLRKLKLCLSFVILAGLSGNLTIVHAQAGPSQCGPVINGAILNFSFECLNDMTMLQTAVNNFNWQYAQDSLKDGLVGNSFGGQFEIHGIAFKETNEEVFIVLNTALDPAGTNVNGTLVTDGDLFLNFSGLDFKTASMQAKLYAIRFSAGNDSGAPGLGLYKDVTSKSVSAANWGYATLQLYEDKVNSLAGVIGYGSFDETQTYYAKDISYNVIDSGTFLGPITPLTVADLIAVGYDTSVFVGPFTSALKFQKSLILDQCGVFGGNGSTCKDCAGTLCGTTQFDVCGICGGNGTACLDCAGVPNGQSVRDQCGVCAGNGTSCLDCAGTVNGTKVVDQCGICGGDGTTCLDCSGVVNGTTAVDQCGVCGGNGTSCLDCAGTVNGTAVKDQCGVCGGDGTSCLDCAGVVNGITQFDQCGICGGNGASCLDCAGTVNGSAKADRCGVCNGDGNSCLGCSNIDSKDTIIVLDNSVRQQKLALETLARQVKRHAKVNAKLAKVATDSATQGDKLFQAIWQSVWSLPVNITVCTNTQFCTSVNEYQTTLSQYKASVQELYNLSTNLLKRARRELKDSRFARKLEKKFKADYDLSLTAVSAYPAVSSSCVAAQ